VWKGRELQKFTAKTPRRQEELYDPTSNKPLVGDSGGEDFESEVIQRCLDRRAMLFHEAVVTP
jgi:hypothetical protein